MLLSDTSSRIETACRSAGLPVPSPDDTEKLILVALQILANREQRRERCSQFQKNYTIPITTGIASFAPLTDLLPDFVEDLQHSDGTMVSLLPAHASRQALRFEKNLFFYTAVRAADRFEIMQGDTTNVPDGYLSFKGGYTPTLADLREQFADNLIEIVKGLVAGTESKDEQTAAA